MAEHTKQELAPQQRHERPEDWGWHANFPRITRAGGWLAVALLLVLLIGNHQGHTEDVWLVSLAALIVLGLFVERYHRKNAWRDE